MLLHHETIVLTAASGLAGYISFALTVGVVVINYWVRLIRAALKPKSSEPDTKEQP